MRYDAIQVEYIKYELLIHLSALITSLCPLQSSSNNTEVVNNNTEIIMKYFINIRKL